MIGLITQCGIMIFIGIGGGGTVWLQNWKYGESLTLTVFSLTHKFKGPCVSDSLKNFLNENWGKIGAEDPGHQQTLIDYSLGHAPPFQKINQNPFITATPDAVADFTHAQRNYCQLYPKADIHFAVPWRVEGWVDSGGWLNTRESEMVSYITK